MSLPEAVRKWKGALTSLAMLLFGISFFLPSFDTSGFDGVGWECAEICLELTLDLSPDTFGWWYYGAFNLSNLAMVAMPILLLTIYRKKAVPLGIVLAQGILLLHVLSWPIIVVQEVDGTRGEIEVGYYLWLLSMIIVFGLSISRDR